MFMEFVRVCTTFPDFEIMLDVGDVYIMADIIELHKTQIVGLAAPLVEVEAGVSPPKRLVAFNFGQIKSIRIPPAYEERYLELMKYVNERIKRMSKGQRTVINAKPEAIYNAFYEVLAQLGAQIFGKDT